MLPHGDPMRRLTPQIVIGFISIFAYAGCTSTPSLPVVGDNLHIEKVNDPSGVLIETRSYYLSASGEKVLHGPDISYFDNGKKRLEVPYRDGLREGVLTEWDPYEGYVVRQETYKANLREGPAIRWHSPGHKSSECTYHEDLIVGKQRYWNSTNGGLQIEEVYDDQGHLSEGTKFYDNGQKKLHGYFRGVWPDVWGGAWLAGKRDGTWSYWDSSGKLVAEGTWKDGKPWEGTCIVPTPSGSLWVGQRGNYQRGQLVGEVTRQLDF